MLAVDPRTATIPSTRRPSTSTISISTTARGREPLGQVQLLGRDDRADSESRLRSCSRVRAEHGQPASVDWYLMSEDLPRTRKPGHGRWHRIILEWHFTNMKAHRSLVARWQGAHALGGLPILLLASSARMPSHQCGTVRIGNDPGRPSPLDPCAAASITRISSSSMPASCRPRRRSTRRSPSPRRRCAWPTTSARRSWHA